MVSKYCEKKIVGYYAQQKSNPIHLLRLKLSSTKKNYMLLNLETFCHHNITAVRIIESFLKGSAITLLEDERRGSAEPLQHYVACASMDKQGRLMNPNITSPSRSYNVI